MRSTRLAAAALLAFSGAALGQSEGVAEFKGSMSGPAGQLIPSSGRVYLSKEGYRMEWEIDLKSIPEKTKGHPGATAPASYKMVTIQKASDQDHLLLVNDARKTFAVTDLKKRRENIAGMPKTTYAVKKLGGDTVAGFPCKKALVTSSLGTETELCIATDLIASSSWITAMNRQDPFGNLLTALRDNGLRGFPVRMSVRGHEDSQLVSTTELVRFEKKPVPSSLFEVPAGYAQTSEDAVNLTAEQEKMMKDAREKMKKSRGGQ